MQAPNNWLSEELLRSGAGYNTPPPNTDPMREPTRNDLFPGGTINLYEYEDLLEPGMSIMDWRDAIIRRARNQAVYSERNTTDGRINYGDYAVPIGVGGTYDNPNVPVNPGIGASSAPFQITPGVNPFIGAAQRAGYSDFADPMATQKSQAAALRGANNG